MPSMSQCEDRARASAMSEVKSTCAHCGRQFTHPKARAGRQHRKWCSARCRAKASRGAGIGNRYVLTCTVCSALFTGTHAHHKTCSKQCRLRCRADAAAVNRKSRGEQANLRWIDCCGCGQRTQSKSSTGICEQCRIEKPVHKKIARLERMVSRIERRIANLEAAVKCSTCDNRTTYRNKEGRCRVCRAKLPAGRCRGCDAQLVSALNKLCACCRRKKKQDDKHHLARARRLGLEREIVHRNKVFERDKWRCNHCQCKCVRPTAKTANNPNSATLDHIIPISRGGPHTYANSQLLCRRCNSLKGASMDKPEQLRLIG
jgi:5-methylcytosine-specific restriction endonuclease McrA